MERLVARYLAAADQGAASEVVRLAVEMLPKEQCADLRQAVERALQIREEALLIVWEQLSSLLTKTDPDSLKELYLRVAYGTDDPERTPDPRLIPIRHELEKRGEKLPDPRLYSPRIDAEREESDPQMPEINDNFTLNDALRWSVEAPKEYPSGKLGEAFIDFLSYRKACVVRDERIPALKDAMRRLDEQHNQETNPGLRNYFEREIKKYQEELDKLKQLETYLSNYSPGKKVPDDIKEEAAKRYEERWKNGPPLRKDDLCFLYSEFRPFWEQHKYKERWEKERKDRATGAERTNKIKEEKKLLRAARAFAERYPEPRQRTDQTARSFSIPGVDKEDCAGFLMLLVDAQNQRDSESFVAEKLKRPAWREKNQSTVGPLRRKNGQFGGGMSGVETRPEVKPIELERKSIAACLTFDVQAIDKRLEELNQNRPRRG